MNIVAEIVKSIADNDYLDTHLIISYPIRNLVLKHNNIAINDYNLLTLHENSTGLQLKEEIAKHKPEIQVALLHEYLVDVDGAIAGLNAGIDLHKVQNIITEKELEEAVEIGVKKEHEEEVKVEDAIHGIVLVGGILLLIIYVLVELWLNRMNINSELIHKMIETIAEGLKFFIE